MMEHILDIIGAILQLFPGVSFRNDRHFPNEVKHE